MAPESRFKGPITAEELMAKLNADPKWVAADKARREKRKKLKQMLDDNQRPIVQDLCSAGYQVKSVYDLVNTNDSYPKAVPILLEHLRRGEAYDSRIREGIARALTVKEAKSSLNELLAAFRRDPDKSLNGAKGALGNAISLLADLAHQREIVELALDRSHGPARWALVDWLGGQQNVVATEALEQLVDDPEIEIRLKAQDYLQRRAR